MVEFGLILPVFFMLTVAVVDVGRAFFQYNSVSFAAREAARYGSVGGGSQHPEFDWATPYNGNTPGVYSTSSGHPVPDYAGTPTIVGRVIELCAGCDLNNLTITISAPDASGASPGNTLGVTVVYAFQPATSLFLNGQSFPVTASSRMVIE